MGYRNFFYKIEKNKYELVKNMSLNELIAFQNNKYDESYITDLIDQNFIVELGGTIDSDSDKILFANKETFKNFFLKKEVQKYHTEDNEAYVVTKEFVLTLIDILHEKIIKIHRTMLEPFLQEKEELYYGDLKSEVKNIEEIVNNQDKHKIKSIKKIIDYFFVDLQSFGSSKSFSGNKPYNLDQKQQMFSPTDYRYILFNVVQLYRTFDFEKDILVFYGG